MRGYRSKERRRRTALRIHETARNRAFAEENHFLEQYHKKQIVKLKEKLGEH